MVVYMIESESVSSRINICLFVYFFSKLIHNWLYILCNATLHTSKWFALCLCCEYKILLEDTQFPFFQIPPPPSVVFFCLSTAGFSDVREGLRTPLSTKYPKYFIPPSERNTDFSVCLLWALALHLFQLWGLNSCILNPSPQCLYSFWNSYVSLALC